MTGKTRYDLDRSAHAVYSLHYHIIFVIKYRRKALHSEKIRERLKEIFRELAPGLKIEITGMEPAEDHIHMLIQSCSDGNSCMTSARDLSGIAAEGLPGERGRLVAVHPAQLHATSLGPSRHTGDRLRQPEGTGGRV